MNTEKKTSSVIQISRPARKGDICVLIEHESSESKHVVELQKTLQTHFNGELNDSVHLTCMRFEVPNDFVQSDIMRKLIQLLSTFASFPIEAEDLILSYHFFWKMRLLRWRVSAGPELQRLRWNLEKTITRFGGITHYINAGSWNYGIVTGLHNVDEMDINYPIDGVEFPCHIFNAKTARISQILGPGKFKLLETVPLL
ncbi:hypothetical protein KAJ27_21760 [bacterium]|nr:hypothetical protein [bacterium]